MPFHFVFWAFGGGGDGWDKKLWWEVTNSDSKPTKTNVETNKSPGNHKFFSSWLIALIKLNIFIGCFFLHTDEEVKYFLCIFRNQNVCFLHFLVLGTVNAEKLFDKIYFFLVLMPGGEMQTDWLLSMSSVFWSNWFSDELVVHLHVI